METFRVRFVDARGRVAAIELVRELLGVGLRAAEELVATRGVILDNVSSSEARRVVDSFARIGASVELEPGSRHIYAYAPEHPARADQRIACMRSADLDVSIDHGPLGALEPGAPQQFPDSALTLARARAQLESWRAQGLVFADTELEVLLALSARDLALEAHLREHPDDVDAHLIYGDWLQSRGDVRGQLVLLQHAIAEASSGPAPISMLAARRRGPHAPSTADERSLVMQLRERERELLREHGGQLFGPLRPIADAIVVRWSLGFVDTAFVGALGRRSAPAGLLQVLHDLLRLPIAARMQSLGLTSALLRRPQLESLLCASEVVASLRELELGDHLPGPGLARSLAEAMPRKFTHLWSHLRKLRKLKLHSNHPPLRSLHSETLEHLALHMLSLPDNLHEPFVDGRLPMLHTLTLDFASADRMTPAAFAHLLALPDFDSITTLILQLPNHYIPEALANTFASIPRLGSLEVLDLSRCVVDERTMQTIVDARDRGRLPEGLRLPTIHGRTA